MNTAELYICNWSYVKAKHIWENIDTDLCGIEETKEEFLEDIKSNVQEAIWFFQECLNWGMKETAEYKDLEYLNPDDDADVWIYRLGDSHIKLTRNHFMQDYEVSFATVQTKTVTYYN